MGSNHSWNKFINELEEGQEGNKQVFAVIKISDSQ
jgi:hypothetical protein